MSNQKKKLIAIILLLSIVCIPPTLSIFRKKIDSFGSIDAANWYVGLNQNGISNNVVAIAGSSNGVYTLKIVSESSVDTAYSITVSGIPSGVDVSLDDYDNGAFQTPSNGIVTFNHAGIINYTGLREEVTRILTFRANDGATLVQNQSVNISVDFVQN